MKAKKLVVFSVLMVLILTLTSFKTSTISNETINQSVIIQEGLIVYATYSGQTDSGYKFVVKDRNDNEQIINFQIVDAAALKAFDLNSETFIGILFKITFNRNEKLTEGEINTITKLEKL